MIMKAMKKTMMYITLSILLSCGEYSVNHEVLNEGENIPINYNWDNVVGTYLMDKKSLDGLNLPESTKFYVVINKDSTFHLNRYMDDDTLKIVNKVFSDKIMPVYFYDEKLKRLNKDSILNYPAMNTPPQSNLFLKRYKSTKNLFVRVSYFPDLSYDPTGIRDLSYVLKYDKISDEPMNMEELEKTIQ